jgi:predicted membrane protein DUF2127
MERWPPVGPAQQATKARQATATLLLIAIFKLLKGAALIAVAIGAMKLLHQDVAETVLHWISFLRVDPENKLIHGLLARLLRVSPINSGR